MGLGMTSLHLALTTPLEVEDEVVKKVMRSTHHMEGKLEPKWLGPCTIIVVGTSEKINTLIVMKNVNWPASSQPPTVQLPELEVVPNSDAEIDIEVEVLIIGNLSSNMSKES